MSGIPEKDKRKQMPETTTLRHIEDARSLVERHLIQTPLIYSPEFSEASGNEVYFKLETCQRTHSFKARGALNKVASLSTAERERGVMAASSGNHALGVAYAAALLESKATVVMPTTAPVIKVELARRYGAKVILHGEAYGDALEHAARLAQETQMVLLPSFDDLKVIAGQGTIALEVLDALPDVELVICPIGGGGLIAGLAIALNATSHPAELVGVEAEGAACMLASLQAGHLFRLEDPRTIADGIAIAQPGRLNLAIVQHYAPSVITVSDEQILDGMVRMLWDMRVVVEPAAAAAPAALLFHETLRDRGLKVCCIVSGGNVARALLETVVVGEQSPQRRRAAG